MQNNKIVLLALIFSLIATSVAWADLDIDTTKEMLNQYLFFRKVNVPKEEQVKELDGIKQKIDQALQKNPNDPVLWWLMGLTEMSYLNAWNLSWKEDRRNIDIIQNQKAIAFEKFRKSLELDRGEEHRLTPEMLNSLIRFGSSDVHVEAGYRILQEETRIDPRQEKELRAGMATHFIRLGRYDEAVEILEEWAEKYPDKAEQVSGYISGVRKEIAEAKQKQQAENEPAEKEAVPEEEQKQVKSVIQQPVAKPVPQSTNKPIDSHASDEEQYRQWILILTLIAIGLAVIIYILRRPRK